MRDSFCAHDGLSHLAQLVLSLLKCNMMNNKVTLGVRDQMKIFYSLVNPDGIHKTGRVGYISSDLAINLNELLHTDRCYFICQGILESVP